MIWQEITTNEAANAFLFQGKTVFNREFIHVLSFHAPGIAPVCDNRGWFHINIDGEDLYPERYLRTFGFYYDRASVAIPEGCFHIDSNGKPVYGEIFAWCGNYQQKVCAVRNHKGYYYHIDIYGQRIYNENYLYAGDFYDGIACVKTTDGWKHIRLDGFDLNGQLYLDLGVFHKGFAPVRDSMGWFHVDKSGKQIYNARYNAIEPFYNGFSLVTKADYTKVLINEQGEDIKVI